MAIRYCQMCNVPLMLTSEHAWGSNGTITLTGDSTHRMVIVDNEALNNVFDSISRRIGLPLDNLILEAKRKSGKHFMDALLSGIKGVVARNLISAKVYQRLGKQVSMLGLGSAEVIAYRRHSFLEGLATDAYSAPALAGDICGAFESVEGCRAVAQFSHDDDGSLRIEITKTDLHNREYEDRFDYRPPPVLPGRNIFELCPVCNAPLQLGNRYSFDVDRGLMFESKTGHRSVLMGVMTLKNLFGELERELGEEIPHLIMTIERDRVKDVVAGKEGELDTSEEGYRRYMKTLEIRGMGNGSYVSFAGDRVTARVDNPYYEPLIAGFLAGFFEATRGVGAVAEWTPADQGYTEVTLSQA